MKKLPVEGITAEEVLHLWQQGALYVEINEPQETAERQLDRCRQEALAYVGRLEPYVNAPWKPFVRQLWQTIVCDEAFTHQLVIRKGSRQGQLNRYFITNIVFHLKALDVYLCDSLLDLHKTLEGVERKNSIYKSAAIYALSLRQRIRLREISKEAAGLK
ncbi:MAG: hypothetical protein IJ256_10050 [Bacteroidaceae bacterium]|nr:hypothetical protein [Bacteroidaceae bacterium]